MLDLGAADLRQEVGLFFLQFFRQRTELIEGTCPPQPCLSASDSWRGGQGGGVEALTLKGPDQRLGVKGMVRGAGSAVGRARSLGEGVDKVANNKVLAGEVVEGEAGPAGEEGAVVCAARDGAFHGRGHRRSAVHAVRRVCRVAGESSVKVVKTGFRLSRCRRGWLFLGPGVIGED